MASSNLYAAKTTNYLVSAEDPHCHELLGKPIKSYLETCTTQQNLIKNTGSRTTVTAILTWDEYRSFEALSLPRADLHNIKYYTLLIDEQGVVTGTRELASDTYVIDHFVTLKDVSSHYLLTRADILDNVLLIDARLYPQQSAFFQQLAGRQLILGAYFGIMLLTLIAALVMASKAKIKKVICSYCWLIFSYHILAIGAVWGLSSYLASNLPGIATFTIDKAILINSTLSIWIFFLAVYGHLRGSGFRLGLVYAAIGVGLFFLCTRSHIVLFGFVTLSFISVFNLIKGFKGSMTGRFMSLSFVPITLCSFVPVFYFLGIIDLSFDPIYLLNLSLLWEVSVSLSFAMIGLRKISRERDHNTFKLNSLSVELSKLIGQHSHIHEGILSGLQLEETMPKGMRVGAVICWDVIGSTKLSRIRGKEVLERLIAAISELSMENYNAETLTSPGYVLNEMGDGGLILVGFPYKPTGSLSIADQALTLSEKIIEVADHMLSPTEIGCGYISIGITYGTLTGKFTQSVSQKYQVYGKAITLATRYEELRKLPCKRAEPANSHVIILQDSIYKMVSPSYRERFSYWDIPETGYRIRDEAGHRGAYVAYISSAKSDAVAV